MAVEVGAKRLERRDLADEVGCLLGDHHHGRVDVPVGDEGKNGGVHDADAVETVDAHRLGVDHGSHRARARGVERGLGVPGDPVEDLLVALHRRPR